MRAEAARMEQPTANAAYANDNYDAEYDAPYEPLDDEPRATAQSAARNSAPVFANAPAPGSAYAAGTDYEDGMPFERYTEPGALTADAPAAEPETNSPIIRLLNSRLRLIGEALAQTQPLQPRSRCPHPVIRNSSPSMSRWLNRPTQRPLSPRAPQWLCPR